MLRVDKIIKQSFPALTNRHIEESLQVGLVIGPHGKKITKGMKFENNVLHFDKLRAHLSTLTKGNPDLFIPVVEESCDYWIVDKPAGIASHPIGLMDNRTITHWAFSKLPELSLGFPMVQPTLTPHRLDRGTSGCLMVSKNPKSFDLWRQRFASKQIHKRYLAWCWGMPETKDFEINYSIAHSMDGKRRVIPSLGEKYRKPQLEAQTLFHVIKVDSSQGAFLIEAKCVTGVTHQVRVHLAAKGFPIVGDALYDAFFFQRPFRPDFHLLRGVSLTFGEITFVVPNGGFSDVLR